MNTRRFIYISLFRPEDLRMRRTTPLFALRDYVAPSIDNIWNNNNYFTCLYYFCHWILITSIFCRQNILTGFIISLGCDEFIVLNVQKSGYLKKL